MIFKGHHTDAKCLLIGLFMVAYQKQKSILRIYFITYVCAHVSVNVDVHTGAHKGYKKLSDLLELEPPNMGVENQS